MADNLLREAIAEAKQVKMAAVANAKLALEEAFKPHLASMLSARLRNEQEGDIMDGINPSSTGIGTGDNKMPASDARSSSSIPNPDQELDTYGDNPAGINHTIGGSRKAANTETDAHPLNLHEGPFDNEEEDDLSVDAEEDDITGDEDPTDMNMGAPGMGADPMGNEEPEGDGSELDMGTDDGMGDDSMGGEEGGDQGDLEMGLENIIQQLEQDVRALLGMESPEGGDMGGDMGGEEEIGVEDESMFEAEGGTDTKGDPYNKVEPTDTTDMKPYGKGAVDPKPVQESDESLEEMDTDLEEILREIDVEGGKDPNYFAKVDELQTENVELKRSLKEHREVVRFLKDRIQEINMLNAKLLFTNKLFKEYSLNSGQKMHVVETFDRATTLREVKLIFTTLAETYAGAPVGSTVRHITEGLASKPVGSTKPKSTQILTEADATVERFKKLAGILKS